IECKAPRCIRCRLLLQDVDLAQKISACHVLCSHEIQMAGTDLAIEQGKTPGCELTGQPDQRNFTRVGFVAEHGFPEKHASEGDTIQTADQAAVVPDFDRMGVTKCV